MSKRKRSTGGEEDLLEAIAGELGLVSFYTDGAGRSMVRYKREEFGAFEELGDGGARAALELAMERVRERLERRERNREL